MADPLTETIFLNKFESIEELLRTVDVWIDGAEYRIEVYKNYSNKNTPFTAYRLKRKQVKLNSGSEVAKAFVIDDLAPWVSNRSADGAFGEALGFLKNKSKPNLG